MKIEMRVAEMEVELRALRRTVAALAPALVENVLRELTARGALLVVKSPQEEVIELVERSVAEAVEAERKALAMVESGSVVEDKMTMPEVVNAGEEKRAPAVIESESEEETEKEREKEDEDEEADGEEEVAPFTVDEEEEDHRIVMETSQESSASGSSSSSSSSGSSNSSDTKPLSLSAFDDAVGCRTDTPSSSLTSPPHLLVRVPSRPPVIIQSKIKSKPIMTGSIPPKQSTSMTKVALPAVAPQDLTVSSHHVQVQIPTTSPVYVPPPSSAIVHLATIIPGDSINLPEEFEVQTKDSVAVAWEKWCCGDATRGYPPFRSITAKQVAIKAVNRRLSDLRCAMLPIETMAKTNGMWKPNLTVLEAAAVYVALEDHLPLYAAAPDGRKRKKEIAWSTALNNMRKKRKQQTQDTSVVDQIML